MNKATEILQRIADILCDDYCKHREECYAQNKDPDDAEKALEKFCNDCPLVTML